MDYPQPLLSGTTLGKFMLAEMAGTDKGQAWSLGDLAYDLGDTFESGVAKAAKAGIRPGSNEYAAFITAFSRRVRSRQVAPQKPHFS
ncbi:hypothetical protein [Noviherbaspirillum sedimenti]|uniref:Uncharacterized protein n=1 Tax=Noviherbaspirillum sedimenti TaxID=2320865 RepID=A0A3A3G5W2_9BURK|nr:hypothetical protein [Noviherbaspirillum sedimenti]RJG01902.1 hypothetical protein D3878_10195 [Noviherbaspirillum sedimenti]